MNQETNMVDNLLLTIVLPTLGRAEQVEAMLQSIKNYVLPSNISFEVVVVDQNFSDLLDSIIAKFNSSFPISHYKVSFRGLSKAKNYGAKKAKGKYVCFIDDDAEFTEGLIERAMSRLNDESLDIVSGRCIDREERDSVLPFEHKERVLTLSSFENQFVESTMFFKREICNRFSYDENLGIGSFYGAEEGYDLVYRMLHEDVKILFDPEIKFYHPQTVVSHSAPGMARKAFVYRTGMGYLCKKHKLWKKYFKRLISVICYIPLLCIIRPKDVKFYIGELLGLIAGAIL